MTNANVKKEKKKEKHTQNESYTEVTSYKKIQKKHRGIKELLQKLYRHIWEGRNHVFWNANH